MFIYSSVFNICLVKKSKENQLKKQRKQARRYSASRGFSLAWLLAFTKSFAWTVSRIVGKPRLTSLANDLVNARRHARENETSARRVLLGYTWVKGVCSITRVCMGKRGMYAVLLGYAWVKGVCSITRVYVGERGIQILLG